MKELKAVAILTDNLHKAEQYLAIAPMDSDMLRGWAEIIKEHSEALAELLETQAKLESLREYCREQVDNINKIGDLDIIDVMKRTIYRDMLNKLEEGKAQ